MTDFHVDTAPFSRYIPIIMWGSCRMRTRDCCCQPARPSGARRLRRRASARTTPHQSAPGPCPLPPGPARAPRTSCGGWGAQAEPGSLTLTRASRLLQLEAQVETRGLRRKWGLGGSRVAAAAGSPRARTQWMMESSSMSVAPTMRDGSEDVTRTGFSFVPKGCARDEGRWAGGPFGSRASRARRVRPRPAPAGSPQSRLRGGVCGSPGAAL